MTYNLPLCRRPRRKDSQEYRNNPRTSVFVEGNRRKQHQKDYPITIGHQTIQIITMDNSNAFEVSQPWNLTNCGTYPSPSQKCRRLVDDVLDVGVGGFDGSAKNVGFTRPDHEAGESFNPRNGVQNILGMHRPAVQRILPRKSIRAWVISHTGLTRKLS